MSNTKYTTIETKRRWKYAGTIIAAAVIMSLPAVVVGAAAGYLTLGAISQGWLLLYSTVVLMASTWAFGEETLAAVRRAQGKKTATGKASDEAVVKEVEERESEQEAGGFRWNK